mgnify:FL=1|tara:strand:+ start:3932 stop:5749 length:1818 start_codon:yes stop_codon:yes gene_type:complete
MSKLLANQISNYTDNGPVEAKDGLNVSSGKPFQVAGSSGTSGQYLKSTGSSVAWETFPSIPAAQVQVDWNATSGIAQILNKPSLSTVASSGDYNDLINRPFIPAQQVNSDWNSTSGVSRILNKPSLFSGAYSDLTGRPSIPATVKDLSDVDLPQTITDGIYLQWDATALRWKEGTGSSGLLELLEDTTPQLGGQLDANGNTIDMGVNIISDAACTNWNTAYGWGNHASEGYIKSFTNTTYSQQVVVDGANLILRLTDSFGVQDDISVVGGNGITFSSVTANGFTINSSGGGGGGGATVTIDDTPPSGPAVGDLWWKSDEGRLKVYYSDADATLQWVDANPPLSPSFAPKLSNQTVELEAVTDTFSNSYLKLTGHIIPASNADYDLGNAEYKIRHLFLSDNSLWLGDDNKIDTSSGTIKTKKRNKNVVPASITTAGGDEAGLLAYATVATLAEVTLQKSLDYLTSLDSTKKKIEDLYPAEGATGYTDADWEEITPQTQPGKSVIPTLSNDGDEYDLTKGVSFLRTSVLADFPVKIKGAQAVDGTVVEITIYLPQGSTPRNIDSLSIDGADATQLKITGTPEANVTNTFTIKAIYFGAVWKATVAVG